MALLGYWPGESNKLVSTMSALSRRSNDNVQPGQGQDHDPSTPRGMRAGAFGAGDMSSSDGRWWLSAEGVLVDEPYYDEPSSTPPPTRPFMRSRVPSPSQRPGFQSRAAEAADPELSWRTFPPPQELYIVPSGTPLEIESIAEASVEQLQENLAKEESLRENAALQRAGEESRAQQQPAFTFSAQSQRAHSELPTPKIEITPSGKATDRDNDFNRQDISPGSDSSGATASSADSGYVSAFTDAITSRRMGNLFGFGSSLRRSGRKTVARQASVRSTSTENALDDCVSCFEECNSKDSVPLVCHRYCKGCFQTLISTAIASENQWPPKCCLNEIPSEVILLQLTATMKKKYNEIREEREIPAGERIYCSKSTCGVWIPPRNINKAISCAACPSCRQKSCTSCRGAYHENDDCPQDPSIQATLQLATDQGWRRCYSCKSLVEHNDGCRHMTCKCKAQFCYICGAKWRTCGCSETQLATLRLAAATRMAAAQTQVREQEVQQATALAAARAAEAEAAELERILEEVARFEVEEAERLTREEEELRLVAVAARQQREEQRVLAISKRYFDLQLELDFVHDTQRTAMLSRHENEEENLDKQRRQREEAVLRHSVELQVLHTSSLARLSDARFKYNQDFQAHLVTERETRNQYFTELTAYYKNWPDDGGIAKVAEGMEAFRVQHEGAYRLWDAAMKAKLQKLADEVQKEREQVEARHAGELTILAARIEETDEALKKCRAADVRWLEEVVRVRSQMIAEMEGQEYAFAMD